MVLLEDVDVTRAVEVAVQDLLKRVHLQRRCRREEGTSSSGNKDTAWAAKSALHQIGNGRCNSFGAGHMTKDLMHDDVIGTWNLRPWRGHNAAAALGSLPGRHAGRVLPCNEVKRSSRWQ
eukprot:TRINITY_DN42912_c0_g1_i1.p1 TRINITY_DN42912_c0_g1~~TRINITY_DN42912_c0_g1_i1.p1  ORF type:complete len:120 (+),score=23.69 TRINITY_DN42912_c0_g1_i1:239-598(+)